MANERKLRLGGRSGSIITLRPSDEEDRALDALGGRGEWGGAAVAALRGYLGRPPTLERLRDELGEPTRTRILEVLLAVVGHEPWRPDPARVARARRELRSRRE